jgi:prepilin-type N-terminal cleavage/methylation domain-containing protein
MSGSRGFTLLELMVAVIVLAVGFSVVFELLHRARLEYENSKKVFEDLLSLNNDLVEGRTEGINMDRSRLKDYPEVEEIRYSLGSVEIYQYRLAR